MLIYRKRALLLIPVFQAWVESYVLLDLHTSTSASSPDEPASHNIFGGKS